MRGEIKLCVCKVMGHGELHKNCWTDQHAVLGKNSDGPKEPCIRWGANPPRERGTFRGLSAPFKTIVNLRCGGRCSVASAFAAKGIIQSPITSYSMPRDHSVSKASANSILQISWRKQCGLSTAKGVVGLHSAGEVWYLRLLCFHVHAVWR